MDIFDNSFGRGCNQESKLGEDGAAYCHVLLQEYVRVPLECVKQRVEVIQIYRFAVIDCRLVENDRFGVVLLHCCFDEF